MSRVSKEDIVDFGYAEVPRSEKPKLVRDVFQSVAENYDIMNDVMSLGVHRLWKRHLISRISPKAGHKLIDVAGGTGDISKLFLKGGGGSATLCDLTPEMLEVGKDRLLNTGVLGVDWICAKAEALPLADREFDVYTISFGLRNVADRMAALHEAFRVLKPGGRYFCLEFSPTVLPVLQELYDLYSDQLLPKLGQWIANDADSYRYLVESIRRFRAPEGLSTDLCDVGFACVSATPLSGGIVYIHQGLRP